VNFNDPNGLAARAVATWAQTEGISYANTGLNVITPGSNAFQQSYLNYQAGNYPQTALWTIQGGLELGAAAVTGGASQLESRTASSLANAVANTANQYSKIGSTGQIGENALKLLGGESQVFFNTNQGGRYVDQLVNRVANESKVGYTSLTSDIRNQIAKDAELINTGRIDGSTWHFFQSPVTGVGGPSQPLLDMLKQNGINIIIH
jgi:hypothetical protein